MADANTPHLWFEASALDAETFDVTSFEGEERISQPYRFEVELTSTDPAVDFDKVLGKAATLYLARGLERVPIHGVVTDFQQLGHTAQRYGYRAVLVPHLALLALAQRSRVFQEATVEHVVTAVLEEAGLTSGQQFRFELSGSYPSREYVVQYQESDLAFMSRELEHFGIRYYFEHTERDVLVMTDAAQAPRVAAPASLPYNDGGGLMAESESVSSFVHRGRVVTGQVKLKDYHYLTPEVDLLTESAITPTAPGPHYEVGQHFKDTAEGKVLAKVRNEELEVARHVMSGGSDCPAIRCGHVFELTDHFRADLDGDYLVVSVRHAGTQRLAFGGSPSGNGEAAEDTYGNAFTCVRADVPYRPPRLTPKPRVHGVTTAKTESPGGEYAHLDEHGRYRVRHPFDLEDEGAGKNSLAIRMAQPYSGANYGFHFPHHPGTELVLAYIDGDVNRPIALGSAPNPSQASPVVAENRMQNIVRTASGSEFLLDDTKDKQVIHLKTPKTHIVKLDDSNDTVSIRTRSGHTAVFDDPKRQILIQTKKGHQIVIGDGDKDDAGAKGQHITLTKADGTVYVKLDLTEDNIEIASEEGNIKLRAPKGNIEMESKGLMVTVEENAEVDIGKDYEESIGGDVKSKVSGKVDEKVTGAATRKVTGKVTEESSQDYAIKGSMNVKLEAGMELKAKGGMKASVEGGMQAEVKGGMQATVQGGAMTAVKGGVVMIN